MRESPIDMVLVHDVPFEKVQEQKDIIKSWHNGIEKDFIGQFEKFVGSTGVRWFEMFSDDGNELLAVAGMVEFYGEPKNGLFNDGVENMVFLNQLWAKSGNGKKMVDLLFEYFKKYRKHKDIEIFEFSAYNPKVIDHYKKNYKEYKFVGNNKWGYPTFQRRFAD